MVKNLPQMCETWVRSFNWKDHLEEGIAAHISILAWRILWTEEPGRLQSMGSQRDAFTFQFNPKGKVGNGREGPLLSPSAGECMMECPPALWRNILFSRVCDREVRTEAQTEPLFPLHLLDYDKMERHQKAVYGKFYIYKLILLINVLNQNHYLYNHGDNVKKVYICSGRGSP